MLPLQESAHHHLRYTEEDRGFSTPCWIWRLGLRGEYPVLTVKYVKFNAHRWFYLQLVGPIPDGFDIHHLCDQKLCVNPSHMRAITEAEHVRVHHAGRRKTHCIRGHPFDERNTAITPKGAQRCRRCAVFHTELARRRRREYKGS